MLIGYVLLSCRKSAPNERIRSRRNGLREAIQLAHKPVPLRGSANGNRYSPHGRGILTGVTRQSIDITCPKVGQIDIRDIARSLARQERYTGHCPLRPTVARHSVAVAYIAARLWRHDNIDDALSSAPTGLY